MILPLAMVAALLAAPTASATERSGYDSVVLADQPVAYWTLGDTGSTLTDSTGGGHTGQYVGDPAATSLPNGDPARVFDGATQYAEAPDAADLSVPQTGVLTLEAWLRPDTLQFPNDQSSGYVHWMGKGESGQHEYVARMYSLENDEDRPNRISGYGFNLSGGLGVGSYFQDAIVAGDWIHYVLVINTVDVSADYPSGYTKIYRDGVLRDQDDLSELSIVPGDGTAPYRIGTRDFGSYFLGAIGKVAVYDAELSTARIAAHFSEMTLN